MDTVPSTRPGNSSRVASVLNVLAGVWVIISPFVLGFSSSPAALWATLIPGIVVLALAWIRANNPAANVGLSWVNVLAGIWLIIAPWVCRFALLHRATTNGVILGIVVGILGLWSARPAAPRIR
jgi:hypothetical protein